VPGRADRAVSALCDLAHQVLHEPSGRHPVNGVVIERHRQVEDFANLYAVINHPWLPWRLPVRGLDEDGKGHAGAIDLPFHREGDVDVVSSCLGAASPRELGGRSSSSLWSPRAAMAATSASMCSIKGAGAADTPFSVRVTCTPWHILLIRS
jgi:hypothetical protein